MIWDVVFYVSVALLIAAVVMKIRQLDASRSMGPADLSRHEMDMVWQSPHGTWRGTWPPKPMPKPTVRR